jgi:hypothetical protein
MLKIGSTRNWFENLPLASAVETKDESSDGLKPSCVDIALGRKTDEVNFGSSWNICDLFKELKKRHCIVINEAESKYCVFGNLPKDPASHEYYLLTHNHIEKVNVKCCNYDEEQNIDLAFSEGGLIRAIKGLEPSKHKAFEGSYGDLCEIAADKDIVSLASIVALISFLALVAFMFGVSAFTLPQTMKVKTKIKVDEVPTQKVDIESLETVEIAPKIDNKLFFSEMLTERNIAKALYKPSPRCVDIAFGINDDEEGFGTYRSIKDVFRIAKQRKVLLLFTGLGKYYWPDTLPRSENPRFAVGVTEFHDYTMYFA